MVFHYMKGFVPLVIMILNIKDVSLKPFKGQEAFKIVGGHIAKPGEFPYQITLGIKNGGHFCGGSILDKKHILTAAHCAKFFDIHNIYVGAGVTNNSDFEHMKVHNIDKAYIHEKYDDDTFENDIAIIKIKGEFKFSKLIRPLKLSTHQVKEGTKCVLSGWGDWDLYSTEAHDQLKGTHALVSNQTECVANYSSIHKVYLESMLCAGYPDAHTGPCHGDSGGALVCDKKQTGIVSWGNEGCTRLPGFPIVYTRIYKYLNWIRKHGVTVTYEDDSEMNTEYEN
ncbi:chymotrypsin-2-like isoform X1 [Lycorma delicatula]|uniref:chymotrypsin-2-like isoform X1 n=1 Tax=Lycorma delicatula TaxID=130591 RepID=UPI003F50EC49